MYQGLSDGFLGPCDPIAVASEDWGIDFEAEVAVAVDDVPTGRAPGAGNARFWLVYRFEILARQRPERRPFLRIMPALRPTADLGAGSSVQPHPTRSGHNAAVLPI